MKLLRFYFRFLVFGFLIAVSQLSQVSAQDETMADSISSNIEKPFIAPVIVPDSSSVDLRLPDNAIIETTTQIQSFSMRELLQT